jgi:hypothetical protein
LKTKRQEQLNAARKFLVDWLQQNHRQQVWEGTTVLSLIEAVAAPESLRSYLVAMQKPGTWLDTAALHGLACSLEVDVIIFQPVGEPAFIGASLMGNEARLMVPVALENDRHFWALVPGERPVLAPFVDKGDPLARCLQSMCSSGQVPSKGDEDEADPMPPKIQTLGDNEVEAEMSLCQVLVRWDPFASPSPELLSALRALSCAMKEPSRLDYDTTEGRSRALQTLRLEGEGREAGSPTKPNSIVTTWHATEPASS